MTKLKAVGVADRRAGYAATRLHSPWSSSGNREAISGTQCLFVSTGQWHWVPAFAEMTKLEAVGLPNRRWVTPLRG